MHCVRVYITKDDGTFTEVPHLKLPQDFVLFTEKPKGLKKGRLVAYCETDYFGGFGNQRAVVWNSKHNVYSESNSFGAINMALKLLGVACSGEEDEFDTINLGSFRSNYEIDEEIYNNL
jgi:hypothetical protein